MLVDIRLGQECDGRGVTVQTPRMNVECLVPAYPVHEPLTIGRNRRLVHGLRQVEHQLGLSNAIGPTTVEISRLATIGDEQHGAPVRRPPGPVVRAAGKRQA
jgi:hypothetical protein